MSKRGMNIYKRKDGRWEGRYMKNNISGKKQYGYIYAKTYSEVKEKLIKTVNQSAKITDEKKEKVLFKEAAESWLMNIRNNLKETSVIKYENILNKHIYPIFSHREIESVTDTEIEVFLNSLLIKSSSDDRNLAPATVSTVLTVFKGIFRYTSKNKGIKLPDLTGIYIKSTPVIVRTLEIHEQSKLNAYLCNNISLKNIGILLCMYTGMRIGEVCALKWENIHLDRRYISIESTVQRIRQRNISDHKTKLIITDPKSLSSIRDIPIPDIIYDILSEMKQNKDVYLLSGKFDKIPEPRALQNHFKIVLKRCNINDINFHILRHTFATRCIEAGVDTKSLSEILGHASVNITLNRYVHPSMEIKRKNINLFSNFIAVK